MRSVHPSGANKCATSATQPRQSTLAIATSCQLCCKNLGRTLADDNTASHRVTRGEVGHDRRVGDGKICDAIDLEVGSDDGARVSAHPCCAALMPEWHRAIADERNQIERSCSARNHFTRLEPNKR